MKNKQRTLDNGLLTGTDSNSNVVPIHREEWRTYAADVINGSGPKHYRYRVHIPDKVTYEEAVRAVRELLRVENHRLGATVRTKMNTPFSKLTAFHGHLAITYDSGASAWVITVWLAMLNQATGIDIDEFERRLRCSLHCVTDYIGMPIFDTASVQVMSSPSAAPPFGPSCKFVDLFRVDGWLLHEVLSSRWAYVSSADY